MAAVCFYYITDFDETFTVWCRCAFIHGGLRRGWVVGWGRKSPLGLFQELLPEKPTRTSAGETLVSCFWLEKQATWLHHKKLVPTWAASWHFQANVVPSPGWGSHVMRHNGTKVYLWAGRKWRFLKWIICPRSLRVLCFLLHHHPWSHLLLCFITCFTLAAFFLQIQSQQKSPLLFTSSPTLPTHPPTAGLWGWAVSISVFSSVCLYKASSIMQSPPPPHRLIFHMVEVGFHILCRSTAEWNLQNHNQADTAGVLLGRDLEKVIRGRKEHIWTQENSCYDLLDRAKSTRRWWTF